MAIKFDNRIDAMRAQRPARPIRAVPVAPPHSLRRIQSHAKEVIGLCAPADFQAVGLFYRDFPQVENDEVTALLARRGDSQP
ncbi:MAG: hypothetical protein ABI648_11540 [Betaproteobacteria bacterium]|jgi:putative phosphoribosyl transferase